MYEKFYHFSAEPFRLSPDHSFSYAHKGFNKARAYMTYAFMRAEGFVMITGRPGTGKTTLIGTLIAELENKTVSIANLVCTQLQADDLLKLVAYDFGIPPSIVEKGEILQRLTQQLKTWHRDGRRALLIVDEAQDLPTSAMEELRLLTNIQVDARPLLQIFLLGQPELRELVLNPQMEQLHQRIIAATHLVGLASDETENYIRHRLETVHWRGDPAISKSVYPLIHHFSEGVPRRINLICSRLLLHCAVEQRHQVTVADMRAVVQELQNENLASGSHFVESDFLVEDVFDEEILSDEHNIDNHIDLQANSCQPHLEAVPELKVVSGGGQLTPLVTSPTREKIKSKAVPPGEERAVPATAQPSTQNTPFLLKTAAPKAQNRSQPPVREAIFSEASQYSSQTSTVKSDPNTVRAAHQARHDEYTSKSTWPIMAALLVTTLVIISVIANFDIAFLLN